MLGDRELFDRIMCDVNFMRSDAEEKKQETIDEAMGSVLSAMLDATEASRAAPIRITFIKGENSDECAVRSEGTLVGLMNGTISIVRAMFNTIDKGVTEKRTSKEDGDLSKLIFAKLVAEVLSEHAIPREED